MRTSNGSVMMKPASRHLFIGHADDAYAYSVISCNWVSIIDDYHLTKRDFISKDARTQVHVDVPHGVESICSNAFSAGLAELFKGMSSKLHSPVTHVNVASTVKCIDAHSFDCMPSLECVDFCQE